MAKATGETDLRKQDFISLDKACLPMMCRPAAVSQSHGTLRSYWMGNAFTWGTSVDEWLSGAETSGATEAATLAGALPFGALARTLGGGPLYLWVSE